MYDLTKPQKLIYNMEKYAGGAVSVICGSMLMDSKIDIIKIKRIVNEIIKLNDALRIRIEEKDGIVFQYVEDFQERDIEVLLFNDKIQLDSYANKYAKKAINMFNSLCEFKVIELEKYSGFLCKLHHLIGDAWTLSLIGTQFIKIINDEMPECYSYCDYIASEKAYINEKKYYKDRSFFIEQFRKCSEVTLFSEKEVNSMCTDRKTFIINKNKTKTIINYTKKYNSSVFTVFLTALSVYINRIKMNIEKIYIGTAFLNRTGTKEKNTMGIFINTVPVLIELDNEKTFSDNMRSVCANSFSALRHQKYNYGDILDELRKNFKFGGRLYDVMLSYQNAKIIGNEVGFESTWYHCGTQTESLQIHIDDRDNEGTLTINYDYLIKKFASNEIETLHEHIINILFDAIRNEEKKIHELNILTQLEQKKLFFDFNNTVLEYPKDKCVHHLFEEQVLKTPKKTAIIASDKNLTYNELNEEANRIAYSLLKKGIMIGDIVAFSLSRKSYLIAALLGILKAGAAYLPIDLDYPQKRIEYILFDSNAKFYITDDSISELLCNDCTTNPDIMMSSGNLCYCVYTSGSTGMPKGTLLKHQGIVNLVTNLTIYQNLKQCNRIGLMTTITFDVATQEIFTALLNGFTGILTPERKKTKLDEIVNEIVKNDIDVMYVTPTYFDSLTDTDEKAKILLNNIKVVCLAGEKFYLNNYVLKYKDYFNVIFENQYGPVELHVIATATSLRNKDFDSIGKPIANNKAYIVDKYVNPMPIGAIGELCISGDGVGKGYLNRPELTSEKFIDNPFGNGKLYKTGDLAYWREDGNIIYAGRNDFQVKIRGLRIELEEIENTICSVNGIAQVAVVARKDNTDRQLICAFYTEKTPVTIEKLRTAIGQKLPQYMMPHIFIRIPEMPLTSSGKINRQELPEVDLSEIGRNTEYVKPEGEIEKQLAKIISRVLNYSPVGRDDDFFDLGGDSLKAIELVSKAHSEGIYFTMQNVFDYSTVQKLAQCIDKGERQKFSYTDVDFTQTNCILAKNMIEKISCPKKTEIGNILLAGATGFLGIHILSDFLEHNTGIAYCLVRGRNQAESEKRLAELLAFYFDNTFEKTQRIQVICADLQEMYFGLPESKYKQLLVDVDMVINAAASVKHYGSYQYFYETNVESTKRLITFCMDAGANLIHISTLSVSGNSFVDTFDGYISETEKHFYESSLYIGQPLDNVYARSKFEAEKLVLDAMNNGIQANIMRMGNLTNRSSDGKFQKNHESNAFLKRIKAILEMKVFPEYLMDIYVEFTPIDEAANAIMTIARHFNSEQTVFHINSTKVVYMERLIPFFHTLGIALEVISGEEFTTTLRKTIKQSGMEYIFETFINDMDSNEKLNYDSNIRIENEFTAKYLKQLGFEWGEIDLNYLEKYVHYFRKIGYLEV